MSFQQGLSGLNGAAKSLDVIGNNIANSATVGFKHGADASRQQPNQPTPGQQGQQHIDDPHQCVLASSDQFHSHASSCAGLIPRSGLTQRARF